LTKRYGAVDVLKDVDLELSAGTALGLVGENGAGKSTLLGLVSGKTKPSAGRIRIDGVEVDLGSPRVARELGIEIIPQELAYVPDLSVAENLMLANWPKGRWTTSARWVRKAARDALDRLELPMDVTRPMIELTLAERQLVEIAKALIGEARLLILDEPTASLHAHETRFLMERLKALKQRGVALIYVSHHLDETFEISDRVAVLRNGLLVDDATTAATTLDRTVALMLGSETPFELVDRAPIESGAGPSIELRGWSSQRAPRLTDCDVTLRPGEVLGIFGLVGSGAESIAQGLGGHRQLDAGTLSIDGGPVTGAPKNPRGSRRLGIAYVPAERKSDGLALNQSIVENITVMVLDRFGAAGFLKGRARARFAAEAAATADVRSSGLRQEVGELSGGNQQKVLLASRLLAKPRLLVLHEPTRGVDIGSRTQIHRQLAEFARSGAAVVLVTSDVQEAIDATDRLLVMRDGRVVDELAGARKSKNNALSIAAGGSR
jgi:ABC-type sugar transport system ATPase subunit